MEKPWKQRLSEAVPFIILTILTVPLAIGYIWIIISTFSQRTFGLIPGDDEGNFGGLTLENTFYESIRVIFQDGSGSVCQHLIKIGLDRV